MRLKAPCYLLSVDLEDVRFSVPNGRSFRARVPEMTDRILGFLRENKIRITFFTVGDIAREYPEIIRQVVSEGHEIACHTNTHIVLDRQSKELFSSDLAKNLESLYAAGAKEIVGFRAPYFSLTKATAWAYEVLQELGFVYSSSVLPAPNPIYGWPEFNRLGEIRSGILELPMTVTPILGKLMPFAGGVYLRMLPRWAISQLVKRQIRAGEPLLGYLHPFDLDYQQERFPHPGMENNKLHNALMYYNRRTVLNKAQSILSLGLPVQTYKDFVFEMISRNSQTNSAADIPLNSEVKGRSEAIRFSQTAITNWHRLDPEHKITCSQPIQSIKD